MAAMDVESQCAAAGAAAAAPHQSAGAQAFFQGRDFSGPFAEHVVTALEARTQAMLQCVSKAMRAQVRGLPTDGLPLTAHPVPGRLVLRRSRDYVRPRRPEHVHEIKIGDDVFGSGNGVRWREATRLYQEELPRFTALRKLELYLHYEYPRGSFTRLPTTLQELTLHLSEDYEADNYNHDGALRDSHLAQLAHLHQLRKLSVQTLFGLTFEQLPVLPQLQELYFDSPQMDFHGAVVTEDGLRRVARLTQLRKLTLFVDESASADVLADTLGRLAHLEELRLYNWNDDPAVAVPDMHVRTFPPTLRELTVHYDNSSAFNVNAVLRQCPRLERLSLSGACTITPDLPAVHPLRTLDVCTGGYPLEVLEPLSLAGFPELQCVGVTEQEHGDHLSTESMRRVRAAVRATPGVRWEGPQDDLATAVADDA